jgi:hypothetical protein
MAELIETEPAFDIRGGNLHVIGLAGKDFAVPISMARRLVREVRIAIAQHDRHCCQVLPFNRDDPVFVEEKHD